MLKRIHHIDFVVRDLDRAVAQYRRLFGIEPLPREQLPDRGVELVRFRVGESWVILVQPISETSPVRAFLDRHGEGFFHVAYQVEDIGAEARRLEAEGVRTAPLRRGVERWRLLDLDMEETLGAMTQLVGDAGEGGRGEEGG